MSATQSQTPARRVAPAQAFEQNVWTDPGVCNSCFCRIKSDYRRVRDGVVGYDVEDHDAYGEETVRDEDDHVVGTQSKGTHGALRTYHVRTTCDHCGSVGGKAPDDPLSRREALRRVPELAERLREQGISVNEFAIRYTVRELKSNPDLQGADREIFERATKLGVRRA